MIIAVDGNEFELEIPYGSKPGDILEIQLASAEEDDDDDETNTITSVQLINGKSITLHNALPSGKGDNDGTHRMAWPAGRIIAEQGFPSLSLSLNNSILELGSGLGITGLAYAASAQLNGPTCIVLTDCPAAMPLLEYNVEQNKAIFPENVEVKTRALHWSEKGEKPRNDFSLILGSDLLYNLQSIPALVATIKLNLAAGGRMLMAVRWRKPDLERDFFVRTKALGMVWSLLNSSSHTACQLDWEQFGDPSMEASNLYFTQTMVSIQGQPKSIGTITEVDLESMTNAEHTIYESKFVQTYVGVMKSETVTL